jgi:hypothetical protein
MFFLLFFKRILYNTMYTTIGACPVTLLYTSEHSSGKDITAKSLLHLRISSSIRMLSLRS